MQNTQILFDGARRLRDYLSMLEGVEISSHIEPEDDEIFCPHYRITSPTDGSISVHDDCLNIEAPFYLPLTPEEQAQLAEFEDEQGQHDFTTVFKPGYRYEYVRPGEYSEYSPLPNGAWRFEGRVQDDDQSNFQRFQWERKLRFILKGWRFEFEGTYFEAYPPTDGDACHAK